MTTATVKKATPTRVKIDVAQQDRYTVVFLVTGETRAAVLDRAVYDELERKAAADHGLQRPGLGGTPEVYTIGSDGVLPTEYGQAGDRQWQARYHFNGRP